MDRLHILTALKEYERKYPHRFHMPGHKGDRRFRRYFRQAGRDITELSFSDNLQDPSGVIRAAENDVASILGAYRSFFLTDGSTCGVFSMLCAVAHRGQKIIMNRNAHKSAFNACEVLKIEPIVLNQAIIEGVMVPPSLDEIEKSLEDHPDAIGVFLTYPDYYGVTVDLKKVRGLVDRKKKLLLIDGAHGGHFRFDRDAVYAGEYADLWVDGIHKTMPALTQAAILNVAGPALLDDVRESVNRFRTTSPSYPIMASIEYAVTYMNDRLFSRLRKELIPIKRRLTEAGYRFLPNDDPLKLVVDMKSVGISPDCAEDFLNRNRIFFEMNDGRYLVFMLSPFRNLRGLKALERALIRLSKEEALKKTYREQPVSVAESQKIPYLQAVKRGISEWIPVGDAEGRIAAANAGAFPPCVPVVIAGETISAESVAILKRLEHSFGISDGKIKVIKEHYEG